MNNSLKHIPVLDGVRGLAALMVMVFHFHFFGTSTFIHLLDKITVFGQTGVDLFFVLSGFLITRILLTTKGNENFFSSFYARRALRIFPLYYVFLCITYFLVPVITKSAAIPFSHQIWYWVYLQNIPDTFLGYTDQPFHFWSLACEEHFYLIWPFLVYKLNIRNLLRVSVAFVFLALITRFFFLQSKIEVFYFTVTRLDALAIGTILAILEQNRLQFKKDIFLKEMIAIGISLVILWGFLSGQRLDLVQLLKFPLIALFYFGLIGYAVSAPNKNLLVLFFRNRFLSYAGKVSYGLYVYHPLMFNVSSFFFKQNLILNFIVSFVLTFLISSLSYYIFESKILSFKDRFSYSTTSKALV